eukprot:1158522-Pelagomonas_calceolata.AAC.4
MESLKGMRRRGAQRSTGVLKRNKVQGSNQKVQARHHSVQGTTVCMYKVVAGNPLVKVFFKETPLCILSLHAILEAHNARTGE